LALILRKLNSTFGGREMKAVFATIILSILSAWAGVFFITQPCARSNGVDESRAALSGNPAEAAQPRQKIQQWVNY
jgi:hypothetical protein